MEDDDYYGTARRPPPSGMPRAIKMTEAARKASKRSWLSPRHARPKSSPPSALLWASVGIDGLMDAPDGERTVADLLAKAARMAAGA